MRNLYKLMPWLVATLMVAGFSSCEKENPELESDKLIMKSQEITALHYEEFEGQSDHHEIVPFKIYVKGGAPDRLKGDYRFKVANGSQLPEGMQLDTLTGVIKSNGKKVTTQQETIEFEIEVTDGVSSTTNKFLLRSKTIKRGSKKPLPVLQFSSPETRLVFYKKNSFYGVSLTMLGGKPPYNFRLLDSYPLPGELTLNSSNGVISGKISDIPSDSYKFRVQCTDSNGNKAVSLCTSQDYEEFILIVR